MARERLTGAYCYVSAAQSVPLSISLEVIPQAGATPEQTTAAIQTAITAYLRSIAFKQSYVSYAKISDAVLSAEGVVDHSGLTVNGGTENIAVADRQVAVLMEVAVDYAG